MNGEHGTGGQGSSPNREAALLLQRALGPTGSVADLDEAVRLLRGCPRPQEEYDLALHQCLLGVALRVRGLALRARGMLYGVLYPGVRAPSTAWRTDDAEARALLQQGIQALDRLATHAATAQQRELAAESADRMRMWHAMISLSDMADAPSQASLLYLHPGPEVSRDALAAIRTLLASVPDRFRADPALGGLVGVLNAAADALEADDGPEALPVLLDMFRQVFEQAESSAMPLPPWIPRQAAGVAGLLMIRPDLLDHRGATTNDLRRSLAEMPAAHPARPDLLIALGRLRLLDFLGSRQLAVVREARALFAEAVDLLPEGDPRRLDAQEGVGQAGSLAVLAGGTPEEVAEGREVLDLVIDQCPRPLGAADSFRLIGQVFAHAWQSLRIGDVTGLGRAVGRTLDALVAASSQQGRPPDPDVVRSLSAALFLGLTIRGCVTGELQQQELGFAIGRLLDEGGETVVLPGLGSLDQLARTITLASRLEALFRDGAADGGGVPDELADLARGLTELADELPEDSPMLNFTVHTLGLAELFIGLRLGQLPRVDAGLAAMREAASTLDPAFPGTAWMAALAGGSAAYLALHLPDGEFAARWTEDGIGRLRTAVALAADQQARVKLQTMLGELLTARERRRASQGGDVDPRSLDEAVGLLQRAWDDVAGQAARPQAARIGMSLSRALRTAAGHTAAAVDTAATAGTGEACTGETTAVRVGARARSRRIAESALRLRGREVLLQTGTRRALATAREGADEALQLAHWCLADDDLEGAVRALEAGRGLVLAATTSGDEVDRLLREGGYDRLADRWAANRAAQRDLPEPGPAPGLAPAGEGTLQPQPADAPGSDRGEFDRREAALRAALGEVSGAYARDDLSLRHEVLTAIDATAGEGWRSLRWGPGEVAGIVREAGLDAVAYLVPQPPGPESYLEHVEPAGGAVLVVRPDGSVRALPCPGLVVDAGSPLLGFADDDGRPDPAALRRACDWAGEQVMAPLLDHLEATDADVATARGPDPQPEGGATGPGAGWWPRVDGVRLVLVPVGALAVVPWHAALVGDRPSRYACQRAVIGYAASARQLAESLAAQAPASGVPPVLLANPHGSQVLPWASEAALAVRASVHRTALLLGRFGSGVPVAGRGTAAEVLAALASGVPLLELACHARSEADPQRCDLFLADGSLSLERILAHARSGAVHGGGLVLLTGCSSAITRADHDEALALASGLLAAGAGAVIGTRWNVDDAAAAVFGVVLHHLLADPRIPDTATALTAAQRWMLDPHRVAPTAAPAWFTALLAALSDPDDPAAVVSWAAFAHHGAPRAPVVAVPGAVPG